VFGTDHIQSSCRQAIGTKANRVYDNWAHR